MAKPEQKSFRWEEHPSVTLQKLAQKWELEVDSSEYATRLDDQDPLRPHRSKFSMPKMKDLPYTDLKQVDPEDDCVYLCGNSLGLKPISAETRMLDVMKSWGKLGVHSHFHGALPAALCDDYAVETTAKLVGAQPCEVALLNSLTVNLHLMLVSFYRPPGRAVGRYKILIEENTFPSDRYAAMSQLELNGQDVNDALIIVGSREGEENYIHNEDVIKAIKENGQDIAVILLSAVHYYTGQLMDIEAITEAAHKQGCIIGWDLAHAVGNVNLQMHDCGADFAIWCSYKYLNSGAGGIGGLFVHSRHLKVGAGEERKALHGWWSNKPETRFKMAHTLEPAIGASSFKLSNPSPWHAALNLASLEIFEEATMKRILEKQRLLTGYMELLLVKELKPYGICIITPEDPKQRGCQLSIKFPPNKLDSTAQHLHSLGVVFDIRHPDVLRVAPVPLYNSYSDAWRFVKAMSSILSKDSKTIRAR